MNATLILKGGGYSHGVVMGRIPRHHHWTRTTDDVPRTNGVPPVDGGLPKPPGRFKRFLRWMRYYATVRP